MNRQRDSGWESVNVASLVTLVTLHVIKSENVQNRIRKEKGKGNIQGHSYSFPSGLQNISVYSAVAQS